MAGFQRRGVHLLLRDHQGGISIIAFFPISEQYLTPVFAGFVFRCGVGLLVCAKNALAASCSIRFRRWAWAFSATRCKAVNGLRLWPRLLDPCRRGPRDGAFVSALDVKNNNFSRRFAPFL